MGIQDADNARYNLKEALKASMRAKEMGINAHVKKPIDICEIANTIRQVLNRNNEEYPPMDRSR